ncbi:CBS domain-containing protein [Mucilaginibacter arboris]|uniref:CBS domain-containing protein n=1 Tax=Mucilaginibacter arboris TaxID=2682090 RepID=A0A7K1SUI2_9SPHI|nr:CBS domain-containing protein [Mucilaginibacter arboris]MVN20923.1 CBS domain-containing protein [Mucilaginibacter arboris]
MVAAELISDIIPTVKITDTVEKVYLLLAEFRVNELPVVEEDQFLGLITEDDLIEITDEGLRVSSLSVLKPHIFVRENQHIYDVIRMFQGQHLSILPVLDMKNNYLGLIHINNLTDAFATITAAVEPGAIIVLEIDNRDNSMAQMAQIVESDKAQVLSSYIRSFPDSTRLEVTLKINKKEVSVILASFNRYDYVVKAVYNQAQVDDDSMNRYDLLMNYINL